MKYDGTNLEAVVEAHGRWVASSGENDEDRADFSYANLCNENLNRMNLYGADFHSAFLYGADFFQSNLQRCDFTGANLHGANLCQADLRGAIGLPFIPMSCPDTGSFIAWKRAKRRPEGKHYEDSLIVKLLIPEDAERLSLLDGECRASKAIVLEVQTLDGKKLEKTAAVSIFDRKTLYIPGETVECTRFSRDRFTHHAAGIFFFLNRQEAVEYLTWGTDENGRAVPVNGEEIKKALEEANHW